MSTSPRVAALVAALAAVLAACSGEERRVPPTGHRSWEVYGGSPLGIRYSALRQIDKTNVARLEVAWTHDTGDAFKGSEMQCNPIIVGRTLYATTPRMRVIALDAATGAPRWSFDPFAGKQRRQHFRNRGVAHWRSADGAEQRILFTARHLLYALDATTGEPAAGFGVDGTVDLRAGLGRAPDGLSVSATTPGTVYRDLLILGSTVSEALPAAPGHVRAFDVRTGAVRWVFRTIPRPDEPGAETWPEGAWQYTGGANCWAGTTVDRERGLVFVPTGSAAFDFYGANRHGDNLYANCLLCLRADTGARVWHFQVVKHDVWDRDLPAPPSLVTVRRDGRLVDAVAQVTKSGHVFVFERETGRPLFDLEERAVPPSDVEGEQLAATQVLPVRPPPFARQRLTAADLTRRTAEAHAAALVRFEAVRSGGQFTPPSEQGTVVFPGFDGGAEWGGAAFDPATGLLYVNSNEMAWILRLVRRESFGRAKSDRLYLGLCAGCHGADRKGAGDVPGLESTATKYPGDAALITYLKQGAGRMPGYAHLSPPELQALAGYVLRDEVVTVAATTPFSSTHLRFRHDGYNRFLDAEGYPAIAPPWGTLSAIDLDAGTIRWQIPLGEFPALAAQGIRDTGSENYGGPLVTAGGVLFIGATNHDRKFRALDKATGALLWEHVLPAAGNATPATYEVDGRQFVVIGAGGGKSGQPSGGTYVAFALPAR